MLEPADIDSVMNEYTEHFKDRERRARPVGIGLKDTVYNALAREVCNGTMPMLCPESLKPRGVTLLGRFAKRDVSCALLVLDNDRPDCARCSAEHGAYEKAQAVRQARLSTLH